MGKLLLNRAQCAKCKDIIISYYGHDYKTCKCGEISIDGGGEYQRGIAKDLNNIIDLSVYDDENHKTRRNNMHWGRNYDKDTNRLPKTEYLLIKDMNTDHIEAVLTMFKNAETFYTRVFKDELEYRIKLLEEGFTEDLEKLINE